MKKSTAYLTILVVTITIVLVGFFLPIPTIKSFALNTYNTVFNAWIAISATACAFIFLNNKHYWLTIIICGIITSILISLLNNKGINGYQILTRTTAFSYICFALNYIRLLIGK